MSLLERPADVGPEVEVLFREARRRRRRRWIGGIVAAVSVLALVGVLLMTVGGDGIGAGGRASNPSRPGRPSSASAPSPPPAETVRSGTAKVGEGPTAIDFPDPAHGWIASGGNLGLETFNPSIVHTSDGGRTWQRTPVPNLAAQSVSSETDHTFGALVGIHFVDARRGWFFQAGIGWQTNDAGRRWTKMRFPENGALVALTSRGGDVWALVDGCRAHFVSCTQNGAIGTVYHAASAPALKWRRIGEPVPAGVGALFPSAGHEVVVALGLSNYRRSLEHRAGGIATTACTSIGSLRDGELAGVCGGAGGGDASVSQTAVSTNRGATWHVLVAGPPSTEYMGSITTNGADTIFYVTGGQTLWRTAVSEPGWRSVLQAPVGSTDQIYPVYVSGSHGYALVGNGRVSSWFETNDAGVTWEHVARP